MGTEDPTTVVASLAGKPISLGEVDGEARGQLAGAKLEYLKKRYEVRKQALEGLIAERLLKAEASRKGLVDAEALVKSVVDEGTPEPTEDEVQAFWNKTKADPRMAGAELEDVRPKIVGYLHQQKKQQAFATLMDRLRTAANVSVSLTPPRVEVEAKGPATGPKSAPVTMVEFSDFQCPYCGKVEPTITQLRTLYGDKLRIVFRHFPLPFHKNAPKAAEAAACADQQGKFWPMHQRLFAHQDTLAVADLKTHARAIEGLDPALFDACLDSGTMAALVKADQAAGQKVGVSGTPAFFINGVELSGAQPLEAFQKVIDAALETTGPRAKGPAINKK